MPLILLFDKNLDKCIKLIVVNNNVKSDSSSFNITESNSAGLLTQLSQTLRFSNMDDSDSALLLTLFSQTLQCLHN